MSEIRSGSNFSFMSWSKTVFQANFSSVSRRVQAVSDGKLSNIGLLVFCETSVIVRSSIFVDVAGSGAGCKI